MNNIGKICMLETHGGKLLETQVNVHIHYICGSEDPMVETILAVPYNFILFKFDNTDERDKFLEKHKLSKSTQEEMDNLNILIFIKGIEFKIKTFPITNKTLDGDGYN